MALYSEAIVEMNAARTAKYNAQVAARTAEIARQDREYREAVAASEAARAANEAAHAAAMEKWRRDVALCRGGQTNYCAKPTP